MTYISTGRPGSTIRIAMILAVLVVGCSSYQKLVYTTSGYTLRLPRTAPVLVAIPKDAPIAYPSEKPGDTGHTYPESGQTTARVIADAFRPYASKVQLASEGQTLTGVLKQAKADGFEVLVRPTLIQWTERSAHRRDRIVVKLQIYDTRARKLLDSVTIRARSVKRAGAYPRELLYDPIKDYVDSLYLVP